MGWQDAPEVEEAQPKWQTAPEVPGQPSQGVSGTRPGDYTIGGERPESERLQRQLEYTFREVPAPLGAGEQPTGPALGIRGVAQRSPGAFVGIPTAAAAIATQGASLPIQAAIPGIVSAGSEALRQFFAGEPQQPKRALTTGALSAAPPLIGRGVQAAAPALSRIFPGFESAMQRSVTPEAETLAKGLPAPSSAPLRSKLDTYWAAKELGEGGELERMVAFPEAAVAEKAFPEFIDMPQTLAAAKRWRSQLDPVVDKLSKTTGMEGHAEEVKKLLETKAIMTPQEFDRFIQGEREIVAAIAPRGGRTAKAIQEIYDAARQDLAASAELPEHYQSVALQQARTMEAREAAVKEVQRSLTVPAGTKEIPQVVKTVPHSGGRLQYDPDKLLNELKNPESPTSKWMRSQLTPAEYSQLRTNLETWSKFPSSGEGLPGFVQRLLPYAVAGGLGGLIGGAKERSLAGGAKGLLIGELGALGFSGLAQTPAGQAILRNMFLEGGQPLVGGATTALQSTAPALAELLQGGGR